MSAEVACHCVTCSDEGVEMRVLDVDEARGLALCEDGEGARHTVESGLVAPLRRGDVVLTHAAVALTVLKEPAA
jgi:hypothetical protein